MGSVTPRPVQYLPAEGTNFEALAMRSAECGIDALVAQDWQGAQAFFEQCARCCAEAYAVQVREEAARMREQGYAQCFHCSGWVWPDDMVKIPSGFRGQEAGSDTAYRWCKSCAEKHG
jgi:hypothetical protein